MEEKLIFKLRGSEDIDLITRLRENGANLTELFFEFLNNFADVEDAA